MRFLQINLTLLLLFASLGCGEAFRSKSSGGGSSDVGGGGDELISEFIHVTMTLQQEVQQLSAVESWTVEQLSNFKSDFSLILADLVVESTNDSLYAKGKEVSALNFPENKKIIINRTRWQTIYSESALVRKIVLHELLGILQLNDSLYETSNKILDSIQQSSDGETTIFLIKNSGAPGSSEFHSSAQNSIADVDASERNKFYFSREDISPWWGASQGPSFAAKNKQTFRFKNLTPGARYQLKVKFFTTGANPTTLRAYYEGSLVSSHSVNKDHLSINYYWIIPFQAMTTEGDLVISHDYQPADTSYAYLDYILFTVTF